MHNLVILGIGQRQQGTAFARHERLQGCWRLWQLACSLGRLPCLQAGHPYWGKHEARVRGKAFAGWAAPASPRRACLLTQAFDMNKETVLNVDMTGAWGGYPGMDSLLRCLGEDALVRPYHRLLLCSITHHRRNLTLSCSISLCTRAKVVGVGGRSRRMPKTGNSTSICGTKRRDGFGTETALQSTMCEQLISIIGCDSLRDSWRYGWLHA